MARSPSWTSPSRPPGSSKERDMSQLVFDPSKVMKIDHTKRTEYLEGLDTEL